MKTLVNKAFYSLYELTTKISREIKDGGVVTVLDVSDTDLDAIHKQLLKYHRIEVFAHPVYKEYWWHRFLYTVRLRPEPPTPIRVGFKFSVKILHV